MVSSWYNDRNMRKHTSMAESPETSKRKRLFTSRKKKANPVAKPHCATCTCSVVIIINENDATEKDDATTPIKREGDAATTTEDDADTATEDDADDTATEGDAATAKTYFRPTRDNEPRVYTEGKLSPRDISSESEGSIYDPNQEK